MPQLARLSVTLLLLGPLAAGHAQEADDFYGGRTVTILAGSGAGGTTDTTARVIARFIGRHIAGQPNVIVVNMPGGGSVTMTNHLYRSAPRDGATLGYSLPGILTAQLLEPDRARFDGREFNWIGSALKYTGIVSVLDSAPAQNIAEARDVELFIGTTGRGSPAYQYPAMVKALLNLRIELITGYASSNEVVLAMERGEVHGQSSSLQYWEIARPGWLASGRIAHLVYIGPPDPLADASVPYLGDIVATDRERALVDFIATGSYLGWPLFAPPEVPADRVRALRAAFDGLMSDVEFRGAFEATIRTVVQPSSGAEIDRLVEATLSTPPEIIEETRAILGL
ncbi:MAG TPA: hypothetical protein VIV14_07555 [Gammaproteobacteria bacterium]